MKALPQDIVIVGGGTAGWMSACYLARAIEINQANAKAPAPQITLLESADISTVGVGEGSTPYLRFFFDYLGVTESAWMQHCNATFKMGISFEKWTSAGDSYFHPFFSALDMSTADMYFNAVNRRRHGHAEDVNPSHYFTAAHMVNEGISPQAISSSANLDYAYHFDAGLLGDFLKKYAKQKGVSHKIGTVQSVATAGQRINHIVLSDGEILNAELFVDCSGFRGLLGKQALARPFSSYADTLFNDAAVAIPSAALAKPTKALQTRSIALKHGWQWHIPLTNRTGNGYVYSSAFCTASQAEDELRQQLAQHDLNAVSPQQDVRHLTMQVGRLSEHWQGNCLCIGLSQGFIEPLEATALMLVQYALHHFVDCWQSESAQRISHYNTEMNRMFDGIRDYIAAHYYLTTRTDTPYWKACQSELVVPDTLAYLLEAWDKGADFEQALNEVDNKLVYLRPSWYCIFAGMQRFSSITNGTARTLDNTQALNIMAQSINNARVSEG
ncbi:tryptophan 7-halogenase [Alteromonas sp. McT4-15]|uniref:tryptophan halogenase family protein n=1 Tax=Alteromonas sp. McT4-15 TaxID=2881256 RepID=UPI001CF8627C|nr:tryptophan halogenase family protein [Alteromonas sp. McT4-15]MCB4435043.1 tryptophan 7-halogenase [Alteromonas sp. McT4-15]